MTDSKKSRCELGAPSFDPKVLQERARLQLHKQYGRRIMNNVHRAEYVECLVAELLGPEWTLTWTDGYDWAPWDLEHGSDCKLEVKQSAARQPWHIGENFSASPPRFDIAARTAAAINRIIDEAPHAAGVFRKAEIRLDVWNALKPDVQATPRAEAAGPAPDAQNGFRNTGPRVPGRGGTAPAG